MVEFLLPPAPATPPSPSSCRGLSGFPYRINVIKAGRALHELLHKGDQPSKGSGEQDDANARGKSVDFAAMASMEDKEDLYKMLGLQDLRWRASQQDIKKAYRQCVLKYHPDKLNQQEASKEGGDQSLEEVDSEELKDIPTDVVKLVEKLIDQNKTDAQILKNYQFVEFVEGNDVCPKGLENPEEKISRIRRVKEGMSSNETEADQAFKALSNAMAVLSDPQKRRAYDSKDMQADIDDSVPPDKKPKDDDDFFKTWGPVLDRNARWSLKPLPSLGDGSTPIETVLEVYEAWFNFESWRDFTNDIEEAFDLDEASCREERRWMERQNKKQAEKLKKDETRRINMIIETCHKWDPRIQKYKDDLKNAKKASKQAKYADQRKAEEEAKKRAEEEAAAKKKAEEEEAERRKVEKEAKEAAKKSLKKARKALRDAAEAAGLDGMASVKVQEACEASDVTGKAGTMSEEELLQLAESISQVKGGNEEAMPILLQALEKLKVSSGEPEQEGKKEESGGDSLLSQLKQKKEGTKDRKWSREEMDQLHKALIRYPAGTSDRWTKIAQSIGTRSDAECQRKCHELKNNFSANAAGMSVDAELEFQRSKAEALKGHGSRSGAGKKTSGTSVVADRENQRQDGTEEAKEQEAKDETEEKPKAESDWSVEQQRALEAAMAEFKTSTLEAKEKWKAIAERVPGKSDKDCIRRVKEIKAMLASKGSG